MKLIERLNKIANNEISAYDKFKYENKIVNMEYLIDNCLFFSILNDEVEIIDEIEEKKIPEKIKDKYCSQISKVELAQKYNEIIDYLDYLKNKGDK